METIFKVLTGPSYKVEQKLNDLKKDYNPTILGVGATNETITVVVECYPKK